MARRRASRAAKWSPSRDPKTFRAGWPPSDHSSQARAGSILGVPASVAGQVVCALVIDSGRLTRRWPQPLVERLQLIAEILGAALQRGRHESALAQPTSP